MVRIQIKKHVFLVTGGNSGLGAATVSLLSEVGANVVATHRKGEPTHGNARFVKADVTDEQGVETAVSVAIEEFGGLHGVISCAGETLAEKVVGRKGAHSLDAFSEIVQVNLVGTFNVLRLAASAMKSNEPSDSGERGVIINTASISGFDGQVGQAAYSASKAGIVGMTLPISRELGSHGIRVMTVAPGIFDTPMTSRLTEESSAHLVEALPKRSMFPRRLGRSEEYATLVKHIIENEMLNGEVIRLDAGLRMPPK